MQLLADCQYFRIFNCCGKFNITTHKAGDGYQKVGGAQFPMQLYPITIELTFIRAKSCPIYFGMHTCIIVTYNNQSYVRMHTAVPAAHCAMVYMLCIIL